MCTKKIKKEGLNQDRLNYSIVVLIQEKVLVTSLGGNLRKTLRNNMVHACLLCHLPTDIQRKGQDRHSHVMKQFVRKAMKNSFAKRKLTNLLGTLQN